MEKYKRYTILFLSALMLLGVFVQPVLAQEELGKKHFIYDDKGKRDPFWNLVSPSGTIINYETDYMVGDLLLEGIMSGQADQSLAIINGRVVKKGDKIGNFEILEVGDNKVILKKDTQKFELRLKKEE